MSAPHDFVIENGVLKRYTGSDEEVVIPGSVTIIGEMAFEGCVSLVKVHIPDSVTVIDDLAFCGSNLISVNIPDSVTIIGEMAFSSCTSLTSVHIPDSVATIGAE
ncbi:MAG: leucine-rich repeat domain-containing protein, partial [Clostridia bacterium]|nr:leucine-rich repeat domain-containing protein [Clostridia bacterium]